MPATLRPPPDGRARRSPLRRRPTGSASATTAATQPQPNRVRPMSRDMRDVSPGTYVVNPDTTRRISTSDSTGQEFAVDPGLWINGRVPLAGWGIETGINSAGHD